MLKSLQTDDTGKIEDTNFITLHQVSVAIHRNTLILKERLFHKLLFRII